METKNITLVDIANQLHLSSVTISKALRNHPDISISTARLIKNKAKELGYIPNFFAKNLAARRTKLIGLVLPQIADDFYSAIADNVFSNAHANGYSIILMISRNDPIEEEKIFSTFFSMKVDGIILYTHHEIYGAPIYERVKTSSTPIVLYEHGVKTLKVKIDKGQISYQY